MTVDEKYMHRDWSMNVRYIINAAERLRKRNANVALQRRLRDIRDRRRIRGIPYGISEDLGHLGVALPEFSEEIGDKEK
jgi:hypothetical protein